MLVTRLSLALLLAAPLLAQNSFDFIVYGATSAGVTTAIAASRHGLKTVLIEPGTHVGGMATGGLSRTDVGRRETIGGLALEFYYRIGLKYEMNRYLNPVSWFYEPKVGEAVMREMLAEAGVQVFYNKRLHPKNGVAKEGTRLVSIRLEDNTLWQAKVFADTTYEGDLMAQAGVSYTWGRESMAQYGESLAGVRPKTPKHQFTVNVAALDEKGKPLPELAPALEGKTGESDRKIQAYNFRVIATNVAANRIPWPKPEGYSPARYELLARFLEARTKQLKRSLVLHELTMINLQPNGKADLNNNGPFSSDYIGKNYDYPEGSYARRQEIWLDHIRYQQGFYYFLATDPRVPKPLQEEVNTWGLPKDEFTDTNNWPHQLYVREARRMVGELVMVQKDLQTERVKPDVIGMGSYNSDSHNVQRFVNAQGFAENEGDMQVPVEPYQMPYRMLLPKRTEATNLLVPVCFSASHVAYSSLRMEPQYMILGHASGIAAAMAVEANVPLHGIAVPQLQKTLKSEAAVFEYVETEQSKAIELLRNRYRPKSPARSNY